MEFPAMLYKRGSAFEWDQEWFDYVIVTDQDEADIAASDGWTVGKPDPLDHDGDGKPGGSLPKRKPKATSE